MGAVTLATLVPPLVEAHAIVPEGAEVVLALVVRTVYRGMPALWGWLALWPIWLGWLGVTLWRQDRAW